MAQIHVTHFSDPGCPFAYSASPALTALRWRYGDQLAWRHVMIGLTEDAAQYAERGYTTLRMARGNRRFRHFGMPFGRAPKPRLVGDRPRLPRRRRRAARRGPTSSGRCSARCSSPSSRRAAARQRRGAARPRCAASPGVDAEAFARVSTRPTSPRPTRPTAPSRAPPPASPTEFQGKAADTDGAVRYTAPSLVFRTGDGRRLEAGGFQRHDAYDVCIANLDPTLARRGAPEDLGELLDAFPEGLTTAEVAACLTPMPDFADPAAAEDRLLELADAGRAVVEPLGDGALWLGAGDRERARSARHSARAASPAGDARAGARRGSTPTRSRATSPRSSRSRASPATSARRSSASARSPTASGCAPSSSSTTSPRCAPTRAIPARRRRATSSSALEVGRAAPRAARRLCLNGHVDVVGPGEQPWSRDRSRARSRTATSTAAAAPT